MNRIACLDLALQASQLHLREDYPRGTLAGSSFWRSADPARAIEIARAAYVVTRTPAEIGRSMKKATPMIRAGSMEPIAVSHAQRRLRQGLGRDGHDGDFIGRLCHS